VIGTFVAPFVLRSERLCRLSRVLVSASVAALVVFHAWLLLGHLADGRLFEPLVAARWVAGGVLMALLQWLRRLNTPVVWGRRAAIVWLLVFFLHWSAQAPSHGAASDRAYPAPAGVVLVVAPSVVTIGVLAAMLLLLVGGGRHFRVSSRFAGCAALPDARVSSGPCTAAAFARPPPIV